MPTIHRKSTDAGSKDVEQLNRNAQRAINVAAITLPLIFTYLSFKDVQFQDVLKALSGAPVADVLWKSMLAIYFLLWVLGTRTDAADQALVYRHAPNRGGLSYSGIGVIAGIIIFGAILLYSRSFEEFVLALAAFYVMDFLAWRYLVRYIIRPIIGTSRVIYAEERDVIGVEKLAIIETRICGRWKWWRNLTGGVIIVLLGGIALIKRGGGTPPWVDPAVSWELIQVLAITLYVAVMEIWIWWERLRAKVSLQLLDELAERYTLSGISR